MSQANDEQVLVIPAQSLATIGGLTGFSPDIRRYQPLLTSIAAPTFRSRSVVENDPSWLQLIPYLVLRHRKRIFHYTRGQAGGEKRLHSRRSIGIGGHINPCDAESGNLYRAGMLRELQEEVAISGEFRDELFGFVHDPSTPVGQVHLGVVHVLLLPDDKAEARDPAVIECGFAEPEQLIAEMDMFESWSRLVLLAMNS
ncbi:MAG: phosphoesterase [Gemmataceae bacterium]